MHDTTSPRGLTLFHAPMSRSTRLVQLVHELGADEQVRIERVQIRRADGSGGHDPRNPHPDGKVPMLLHDGQPVWESIAIAQHLSELFPQAGLSLPLGHPQRGTLLAWLAWYASTLEPLFVLKLCGVDEPALAGNFRTLAEAGARLATALRGHDYLVADRYTIADLILSSAFGWKPEMTPDDPAVQAWVERCQSRPAVKRAWQDDAAAMKA